MTFDKELAIQQELKVKRDLRDLEVAEVAKDIRTWNSVVLIQALLARSSAARRAARGGPTPLPAAIADWDVLPPTSRGQHIKDAVGGLPII